MGRRQRRCCPHGALLGCCYILLGGSLTSTHAAAFITNTCSSSSSSTSPSLATTSRLDVHPTIHSTTIHYSGIVRRCRRPKAIRQHRLLAKNEDTGSPSRDDDDDATEKDENNLIGSVSRLLPFGNSNSNRDESATKTKDDKKEQSEGGNSFFGALFRRKEDDGSSDRAVTSKKSRKDKGGSDGTATTAKSRQNIFGKRIIEDTQLESVTLKSSRDQQKIKKSSKSEEKVPTKLPTSSKKGSEEASPNPIQRLQGLFGASNRTSADQNEVNSKDLSKSVGDNNNSTSNPFATVQKFFTSLPRISGGTSNTIDNKKLDKNAMKEKWYPVIPKTRIMPGEIVPVTVAGLDLLVVASTDSRSLYCIANSCPHLGTPLESGRLTRLPTEQQQQQAPTSFSSTGSGGKVQQLLSDPMSNNNNRIIPMSEIDVSNILSQDGCEDCIVCPLHHTAFALKSGEVRGEWCPYPPVLGAILGTITPKSSVAVFDIRTRGKNVEVKLNTILPDDPNNTMMMMMSDPNRNKGPPSSSSSSSPPRK